jgi:hypothetical protein
MRTKALVPGVAALLVLAAACSGGGDDEASAGAACDPTTTVAPGADRTAPESGSAGEGTGTDGGPGSGSGEAGPGSDGAAGGGGAGRPEGGALDVELRHPNGIVLRLSDLSFEGDDIVVDAEVVNSSRQEVTIHSDNVAADRLRLVDDAGEEYNFIEPEDESAISLETGETLSGRLAFRGPLLGQPERLQFVVNLTPEELDAFDPAQESESTIFPSFAIPLELTWS